MSASDNEIVFSPLLSDIPFDVDSTFPQRRLFCSIRPPKRERDAPKSTLIFDANYALFKQIARLMTTEFPCRILSSAWRLGLLMALDPYFVSDSERREILASIFVLTLTWHPDSEFEEKEVDALVTQMTVRPPCEALVPVRLRDQSTDKSSTATLLCQVTFRLTPNSLKEFITRPPNMSPTLILTVQFNFSCPMRIIKRKLNALALRLDATHT